MDSDEHSEQSVAVTKDDSYEDALNVEKALAPEIPKPEATSLAASESSKHEPTPEAVSDRPKDESAPQAAPEKPKHESALHVSPEVKAATELADLDLESMRVMLSRLPTEIRQIICSKLPVLLTYVLGHWYEEFTGLCFKQQVIEFLDFPTQPGFMGNVQKMLSILRKEEEGRGGGGQLAKFILEIRLNSWKELEDGGPHKFRAWLEECLKYCQTRNVVALEISSQGSYPKHLYEFALSDFQSSVHSFPLSEVCSSVRSFLLAGFFLDTSYMCVPRLAYLKELRLLDCRVNIESLSVVIERSFNLEVFVLKNFDICKSFPLQFKVDLGSVKILEVSDMRDGCLLVLSGSCVEKVVFRSCRVSFTDDGESDTLVSPINFKDNAIHIKPLKPLDKIARKKKDGRNFVSFGVCILTSTTAGILKYEHELSKRYDPNDPQSKG